MRRLSCLFFLLPMVACNGDTAALSDAAVPDAATRDFTVVDMAQCTCDLVYAPVCGIDGKTYANGCYAACLDVTIAHSGTCEGDGGIADGGTPG